MIDLHLHLDGSLSIDDFKYLAKLNNYELPENLNDEITTSIKCNDLNEYLKCFKLPLLLLQNKESIEYAVRSLVKRLKDSGFIYAEIRFSPLLHLNEGLTISEVIEAAIKGLDKNFKLILCLMRGCDTLNMETVIEAKKYLGHGVCAIDLAGAEGLYKTKDYKEYFLKAKELGIPFTIHAGEADGIHSIYSALSFGAKRIGHSINARYSNTCMTIIKEKNIAVELCPTSNLQTKAVKTMRSYPFKKFIDHGIIVTINTDNITVSNTSIKNEMKLLSDYYNLDKKDIYNLFLNSINVSFTTSDEKNYLINELNLKFDLWYENNIINN